MKLFFGFEIFHDFIARDNPTTAHNVVTSIYEKVQLLEEFPEIGYIYRREKDGDIRILLYGHYKIAYRLIDKNTIDILGIFHDALEIEQYLL